MGGGGDPSDGMNLRPLRVSSSHGMNGPAAGFLPRPKIFIDLEERVTHRCMCGVSKRPP